MSREFIKFRNLGKHILTGIFPGFFPVYIFLVVHISTFVYTWKNNVFLTPWWLLIRLLELTPYLKQFLNKILFALVLGKSSVSLYLQGNYTCRTIFNNWCFLNGFDDTQEIVWQKNTFAYSTSLIVLKLLLSRYLDFNGLPFNLKNRLI